MKTLIGALLLVCISSHAVAMGAVPASTQALQEFSGNYDLADGRLLTVSSHRQQLFMQIDGGPAIELLAANAHTFVAKTGTLRIEFEQAPNGSVARVRVMNAAR